VTVIRRLGLTKLFLWMEAERYQTYPAALARLTLGRAYTRQQVAEELFGLSTGSNRKPQRESLVYNAFGMLQTAEDKLTLRGINLFKRVTPNGSHLASGMKVWERSTDEWIPTSKAEALGKAYLQNPSNTQWQAMLAEQVARYEPRARVLLHLLSTGHELRFATPRYFGGDVEQAVLIGRDSFRLFGEKGTAFSELLSDCQDTAIGPWWRSEIEQAGFVLDDDFRLEGAMNRPPSTNHIAYALKTALYVFKELNILEPREGIWRVNPGVLGQCMSPEVTRDLAGEQFRTPDLSDEWKQVAYVVNALADAQGYVIASEAAERWGELADLPVSERTTAFDRLLRRGIFEERVQILDRHPGQPRMGRGLFDDDNMRMVRLRVLI